MENLAGIPLMRQHGSADHNVPPYHSRRMGELISQTGWSSEYSELEGKGHWFDGVMTTRPLGEFYDRILERTTEKPHIPHHFAVVVANPASTGSRGGVVIDQLMSPNQLGKIEVEQDPTLHVWILRTSNILRFHFMPRKGDDNLLDSISVDGCSMKLPLEHAEIWLVRSNGTWEVSCVS